MTARAKPTDTFRWGNNGAAIVNPASGKKDIGWLPGERPPAQYENYLDNGGFQWRDFTDALFTDGGNANGFAVGHADLSNDAEASVNPLFAWRDYLNNRRSLIDHNGYRMGQVTEADETWQGLYSNTIQYPLASAVPTSGTWSFANGIWTCTASGVLMMSLSGILPVGAVVTAVTFKINRTTTGDTTIMTLQGTVNGAVTGQSVSKTISSGTGQSSVNIMSSPTSGFGPQQIGTMPQVGTGTVQVDDQQLFVTATITTSLIIDGISITYVMMPPGWIVDPTATLGAAATCDNIAAVDPQSGLNQRGLQLLSAAVSAVSGQVNCHTSAFETYLDANCAYVMEFQIRAGTITDGSAHRLFGAGVQSNNGGSKNRWVWLYSDNTFANWQLQVVGASTVNTDTGVAIAANTVFDVRLEILGANASSAGGTNFRVRCFINGSKVADVVSSGPPTADTIRPYFRCGTNGTTGGAYDITVGRVRRAWNHKLAGADL